jgi:hypothetical protein
VKSPFSPGFLERSEKKAAMGSNPFPRTFFFLERKSCTKKKEQPSIYEISIYIGISRLNLFVLEGGY